MACLFYHVCAPGKGKVKTMQSVSPSSFFMPKMHIAYAGTTPAMFACIVYMVAWQGMLIGGWEAERARLTATACPCPPERFAHTGR